MIAMHASSLIYDLRIIHRRLAEHTVTLCASPELEGALLILEDLIGVIEDAQVLFAPPRCKIDTSEAGLGPDLTEDDCCLHRDRGWKPSVPR